jgi:predicted ATPase
MISSPFALEVGLERAAIASWAEYPFSLPIVKTLETLALHPQITFIVGENGSGKSTLLEALALSLGFNAEGGSRNFNFATRPSHSVLHEYLRVSRGIRRPKTGYFFRAESFFNVATEIDRLDAIESAGPSPLLPYCGRSLHEQSHGESFLALLMNRFRGQGLYVLDEPEAALSPPRQLAVLSRLHDLVREGSQFIIATHSPILMAYPDAWIYVCTEAGLTRTAYGDTEHYRVMHDFLANPERMLRVLLER